MRLGGVTRNAIIGKVHRLGLPARDQPKQRMRFTRKRKVKRPLSSAQKVRATVKANVQFATEPLPPEDTPKGPLVMFADLEPHHCRAPYGDPKEIVFGFCGCKTIPGLPYCDDHARRFYTAPKPARHSHHEADKYRADAIEKGKREMAL
jgi:GcrA cell cycle regulator